HYPLLPPATRYSLLTTFAMPILVTPETKILIQGITGEFGARHTKLSLDYGTKVVAGVTPGKGGQFVEHKEHRVPIFNSVAEAPQPTGAPVSAILVPPPFAPAAKLEGGDGGLDVAGCPTDRIPARHMVRGTRRGQARSARLVGPNCPGIVPP